MAFPDCRVYWGSHGCKLERYHSGYHECDCCTCIGGHRDEPDEDNIVCVAKYPYYGVKTQFYGEDANDASIS